jgi:hypothetical protein
MIQGWARVLMTSMLLSCGGSHSMTPESSTGAPGGADSADAPTRPAAPRIDDERVIGPLSALDAMGTASVWIPTRATMLGGVRLGVPAPGGARVDDPALHRQALAELAHLLGAPLPPQVASALTIHDHLLDAATRASYAAKGASITYDPADTRYYAWSGVIDHLHVEITGALGAWAAISISQPISAAEARDANQPRPRPIDALAVVDRIAPAFAARPWQPDPDRPLSNVFDVALHDGATRLRAGVRARGPANAEHYVYAVRINWEN